MEPEPEPEPSKYVRYTREQVEALEGLYHQCPKPSSLRRQQLIRECPLFSNVDPRQIKVWFQNRRCRETQRKEASRLKSVNRKLSAMNRLLVEENGRLQKQVSRLVYDNGNFRQHLHNRCVSIADTNGESVLAIAWPDSHMSPRHPPKDASYSGFLSIAEETLKEFLSKATGTAIEWIQIPGMKPGPDSVGIVGISRNCTGVAARACALVGLEPSKVSIILKDRSLWLCDCRCLDILSAFSTGNGGTIELLYMQIYASTTLASARDFWTLRYTSALEDGSIVVCERSLTGTQGGPSMPSVTNFVRAVMFPSGYLIRPCEGGGSVIHIVDHLDLEPCTAPEVLRPLYESSTILAQTMTIMALNSLCQISQEISGETDPGGRHLSAMRILSKRMNRSFIEAVNGFSDDGWTSMGTNGMEEITVSINTSPIKLLGSKFSSAEGLPSLGFGILCAKASMLLQNVSPTLLVQFLREHRSEWADCGIDIYSAATLKTSPFKLSGSQANCFGAGQFMPPIGQTIRHEEFFEMVKLEGHGLTQEQAVLSRDMVLLQVCSGIGEKAAGARAQLVFAPVDSSFSDDAPLLPSGFRVVALDSEIDGYISSRTLDLASSLDVGLARTPTSINHGGNLVRSKSVLTIAFQFIYEKDLQDNIATMARQYVHSVSAYVQKVVIALAPLGLSPHLGSRPLPGTPEALTLSHWICQSYRFHVGFELLKDNCEDSILNLLWNHPDAIMCCSWKPIRVFTFANQAGLDMLETTLVSLLDISLEKVLDENRHTNLDACFSQIMEQGYTYLPSGICMSSMGRPVSYERAMAWKVVNDDNSTHCIAFMFMNWSFA